MRKSVYIRFVAVVVMLSLMTACSDSGSMKIPAKMGGDQDAHGCIGSAGYKWCVKTSQCERPWELAKKEGFEKSTEAFHSFCGNH